MALLTAYVDVPDEREQQESDTPDQDDDDNDNPAPNNEPAESSSAGACHTSMSIIGRRQALDEWLVTKLATVRDGSPDAQANAQHVVEEYEDELHMLGQREFAQSALGLGYRVSLTEYLQQAELTFTDPLLPGGELVDDGIDRELEAGGATRQVDVRNVHRWVQLVCARWLGDGVAAQVEAFRIGMADFVSVRTLSP